MPDKKEIGMLVKREREKKKMTQEGLAERSGLSRTYVCDIENGRYFPGIKTLLKISKGLGEDNQLLELALKEEANAY